MGMKNKKAQSAMEYLMTYGWAILIIAIVLAALFSLGIFSSSSFTGTTCIASSGFLCSSPVWTSGTLHVTLGQSTGTSWTGVSFFFVPAGVADPTSGSQVTSANYVIGTLTPSTTDLSSGQTVAATFALNGTSQPAGADFSTAPGTSASGAIWVLYNTPSASGLLSQIATTTLKES
ncbi:MAG: hypothetical protein M1465_01325 [Candidatus Marsarchaeota archaeon]|nr:hypothetical protein [Candidatus Marsarchaeota archaeon]